MVQATITRVTPGKGRQEIVLPPEFIYLQDKSNARLKWNPQIDEAKLQRFFHENPYVAGLYELFIADGKEVSFEQLASRGNPITIILDYYMAYQAILKDGQSVSGLKEYEEDRYTVAQRIHTTPGKPRSGKSKRR